MDSPEACPTDRAVLGDDLGFLLGAVFRSYVRTANIVIDQIPGGARGYQVISAAVHGVALSQRGLAEQLGIDRTVMTYLLDDLEAAGLVTRRADPADRRNRHVLPTDKGRELCAATEQRLRGVEACVLEELSAAEQDQLRGLLHRVAGRAVAADPMGDACRVLSDLAAEPPRPGRRPRRS